LATSTPRKRSKRKSSSPAEIRAAAAPLFAECGYWATTMRELGKKLGITAPSLYNHYAEKQDILFDICRDTTLAILEGAEEAIAAGKTPEQQLRNFLTAHVIFHTEHQMEAYVAYAQIHALERKNRKVVVKIRDRYENLLKQILVAGRDKSKWIVPDVSVVAFAIFGMVNGVDAWYQVDGRLAGADVAKIYTDLVVVGLTGKRPRARA
jgi:AcrR family transcriptional regulator